MSETKEAKGGKREGAGRKATKEGSGTTVYVPNDLLPLVRGIIKDYKLDKS